MEQEIASLYEKLYTELFKWCCLMTQNEEMAREIIQEGFLRAMNHYGDIKDLEFAQQRAWFYRTIKNIFIDTLRRGKNESLTADVSEESYGMSGSSFDKYSEKELMCLIESLDILEGKILVLRYIEGFSSGQIGQMLGLPAGTVRSKLHEARKHLRDML